MKKITVSIMLGLFLIGTSQEVLAMGESPVNNYQTTEPATRAAIRLYFKSVPPERYKGRIRINYYRYDGGYTGVYL